MNKDVLESMLTLTAVVARTVPSAGLKEIPIAINKLTKITASLRKRYALSGGCSDAVRYAQEERTDALEAKAKSIANSIGVIVGFKRNSEEAPVVFLVGGELYRLD